MSDQRGQCAGGCGKWATSTGYAYGHAGPLGCDYRSPLAGKPSPGLRLQRGVDRAPRAAPGRVLSYDDALTLLDAQIATVRPQVQALTEQRHGIEAREEEMAGRLEVLNSARAALLDVRALDGVKAVLA